MMDCPNLASVWEQAFGGGLVAGFVVGFAVAIMFAASWVATHRKKLVKP